MDFLSNLSFCKVSFFLKPVEKISLSRFLGATIRGGFGYSFKKLVCININEKNCKICPLNFNCAYFKIFEPFKNDHFDLKLQEIPRPYVLDILMDGKKTVGKDDLFNFNLILIGEAVKYFPFFYLAFEKFGERGFGKKRDKFLVYEILEEYPNKKLIFKKGEENLSLIEAKPLQIEEKALDRIKIKFLTPAKLKYNNKYCDNPTFEILMESILRRIYFLLFFWCGFKMEYNFRELLKEAKKINVEKKNIRWEDMERYSTRQKSKMKLGGIVGEVEYSGNLKPFYPYLKICENIHIGKNTTFGFGKIMLEY